MTNQTTESYSKLAREVRKDVLSLIHKGQTSHIASNFSLVDIATVLYENLKPEDEVVWSKGWASALYYVLNIRKGNLNREEVFNTFPNEPYGALLEPPHQPVPTGSVGHGLPVAVGIAYAKQLAGEPGTVYCLMSDGELNEGTVWESAMLASQLKLDNLVAIIDKNGWCAMGRTKDVIDMGQLHKKWGAFGWEVYEINGHRYGEIAFGLEGITGGRPKVIIANTIKGHGVSFLSDHLLYHYKHVNIEAYESAVKELNGEILDTDLVQKLRQGI